METTERGDSEAVCTALLFGPHYLRLGQERYNPVSTDVEFKLLHGFCLHMKQSSGPHHTGFSVFAGLVAEIEP